MTAPATKLFFSVKAFSSCNHMKGRSGSGTHDVGLIPAMYNSPTAGAQHVHLHSQDWRQASLSNWHPSWSCATQLNRGWLKAGECVLEPMYVWSGGKCMYKCIL